jgi:hypothetical protein
MEAIRLAFPTDEHYPYQDEVARNLALQIVRDFDPQVLISGSDGLDFYAISDFDKNPARIKTGMQDEIDQWKAGQREWRSAAPHSKSFYLTANHDDRLRRYLWRHPEISDLEVLKLPSLLGLDGLGVIWEYEKGEKANQELCIYSLIVKHGKYVRKGSGMTARAELENEKYSRSTLTGHTHRGGSHYVTTRNGLVQAHECFCLCRLDPEYVQHPDWQQGIVLATISAESITVEAVPFIGKKARWRGQEYK